MVASSTVTVPSASSQVSCIAWQTYPKANRTGPFCVGASDARTFLSERGDALNTLTHDVNTVAGTEVHFPRVSAHAGRGKIAE